MFLTKAFHIHDAVLALCKKGMGSEAYGLSRTLIEMYISLRWITNRNANARAKEFGFFVAKRKQYWAQILARDHPTDPKSVAAPEFVEKLYGQYAAKYSSFVFWANVSGKLKGMAEELEELDSSMTPPNTLWDYEVPYSMASDHVHATAAALDPLVPSLGTPYEAKRVRDTKLVNNAAFTATVFLFKIAARINAARKLALDKEIQNAFGPFARNANR
jgi:hypothetical protein